jgi:hypothetical protein
MLPEKIAIHDVKPKRRNLLPKAHIWLKAPPSIRPASKGLPWRIVSLVSRR